MTRWRVCFIGGRRYTQPLNATDEKKIRGLNKVCEIVVIGFSQDLYIRTFVEHAQFYLLPNFPIAILRYAEMFVVGPSLALWCILRHNVEILIAQSPYEGFAAAWAKILARLFGRRVALIVESHGDFEVSVFLQRHILVAPLYRFMMHGTARFALRHADALRCVSNSTGEQLRVWAPAKPIQQFPTWTDIEIFVKAGLRDKRNGKERIILYAGVMTPLKGIHFLLEAFAQVGGETRPAQLWLVGKPDDAKYAQGLREQAKVYGLKEQVYFFEPMRQKKLAEHMAMVDVLVLPSLAEGLPRVVFEAMACGTPVIGSHVGGIPEVIRDKENGFLVAPGDVVSLADRIRWVLQHPEEAQVMGQRGREFATKLFSQEAYVQNYTRLIELACQVVETHA